MGLTAYGAREHVLRRDMEEQTDARAVENIRGFDAAGPNLQVMQLPHEQQSENGKAVGEDVRDRDA
jgi:hypothetical protein